MQAKVTKVRENINSYPNKQELSKAKNPTVFIHGITLEGDPIEYQYHSFTKECTAFLPGTEAEFTTEVKVNGQYTNHKIVPMRSQKPPYIGGPKRAERDSEVITALSSASSAATFYSHGNAPRATGTTPEDMLNLAEKIYNWAISKSKNK